MRRLLLLLILLGLTGCGGPAAATPEPTLGPILSTGIGPRPTADPSFAVATVGAGTQAVPAARTTPAPTLSGATAEEQYRRWMEEARATHPYSETVDLMWQVMICESSGNPAAVGPGGLQGLFQYQPDTWARDWNPYRSEAITDPRAQIFATAKAWSDGNQSWWGVCLP
jgi:hypothetical protein